MGQGERASFAWDPEYDISVVDVRPMFAGMHRPTLEISPVLDICPFITQCQRVIILAHRNSIGSPQSPSPVGATPKE